jgi:tRNA modification GTPase
VILDTDTIVAPATLKGFSAIGIVRLSGEQAIEIADKVFHSNKVKLCEQKANSATFGLFKHKGKVIDQCIFTLFRSPASYTGEDMVEISHHGSPYIQHEIILSLIDLGARSATAGEYTKRAFLHNKMSLSQSEAVADLINADNRVSHDLAMKQLRGNYHTKLQDLRSDLLSLCSLLELELDFGEEDVTFANRKDLHKSLISIDNEVKELLDTFALSNAFRKGISVAIAGKPNSGKSTLLNSLLNDNRSIVSDIAGTTRDTIEERLTVAGFDFRVIDTAGLRSESHNAIENEGIARSYKAIDSAYIVLYVLDLSSTDRNLMNKELEELKANVDLENKELVFIGNKCDIATSDIENVIPISAQYKTNIKSVLDRLVSIAAATDIDNKVVISNARHYEALQSSSKWIQRALEAFAADLPCDLIASDIHSVLYHLGQITGEITTDEILGNIFGRFCIGK